MTPTVYKLYYINYIHYSADTIRLTADRYNNIIIYSQTVINCKRPIANTHMYEQ